MGMQGSGWEEPKGILRQQLLHAKALGAVPPPPFSTSTESKKP